MNTKNAEYLREILATNLNNELNKYGKTKADVSRDLNISEATVRSWFNGKKYPRVDSLQILADYFHTNRSNLTDVQNDKNDWKKNIIIPTEDNTVQIPLLGTIACGDPITAEQNIDSYIPTLKSEIPSGNNFYLMCKGDSMYPTINDGAKVLIHEQPNVEDGEIAAVLIENESTLKRVKRIDGNKVLLMPDNSKFEPILLDGTKNAKILGKAIKVTFEL